jgi:hypothetical protein
METNNPPDDAVDSYRPPGRPGVTFSQVHWAADALLREGVRPTIEKVRSRVGGSPNNIALHLDKWWELLAKRIEIGSEVFERLPRPYAQLAESFFHQSMEEFRKLARAETGPQRDDVAAKAEETRQRTLLLDEREKELAEAIADRDNRIAALETVVAERRNQVTTLLASQDALLRRLGRLTNEFRRMKDRLLLAPNSARLNVARASGAGARTTGRRPPAHESRSRAPSAPKRKTRNLSRHRRTK